jgi:hypothetical protein
MIEIKPDREIAMERVKATRSKSDVVVYSDASGRQGHLGATATAPNDSLETTEGVQIQIGPTDRW